MKKSEIKKIYKFSYTRDLRGNIDPSIPNDVHSETPSATPIAWFISSKHLQYIHLCNIRPHRESAMTYDTKNESSPSPVCSLQ